VVLLENVIETEYIDATVIKGRTYTYKLQARNAYGYSSLSSAVSVLAA
jgi:hypothetical protein